MIDINKWMKTYCFNMAETFGDRIKFIGLQGSYGRDEAKENSDIDVVLILDKINIDDLDTYGRAISKLPERRLICGFISGWEELKAWDKSDLFQFCYDTQEIAGSLEELKASIGEDDIKKAVHTGACNIYHSCVHNYIHEKSAEMLQGLCKMARFVIQAECFLRTGVYIKKKDELLNVVSVEETKILESDADFNELSDLLLEWSGKLIKE